MNGVIHISVKPELIEKAKKIKGNAMANMGKESSYSEIFETAIEIVGEDKIVERLKEKRKK